MLDAFSSEFRAARWAAGLSQMAVAGASGVSRSSIERLELGSFERLTVMDAARLSAVVGLDLQLRTFPGPRAIRDAGQVRLLDRLRRRIGPSWAWEYEVPLPIVRDQRAWDARVRHPITRVEVVIEAVTRLTDVQALLRRIAIKRRDSGSPRVILLLADTRNNANAIHESQAVLGSAFPIDTRAALRALLAGGDPGGDALVVL